MKYFVCLCVSFLLLGCLSAENVRKDYNVKNFNKIQVSGGFDVKLVQGDKESAVLEFDDKIEKYLVVEVVDKTLKIYIKKKNSLKAFSFSSSASSRKAIVFVKDINAVSLTGGGSLSINNFVSSSLKTSLTGGGELLLDVKTDDLKCSITGGGSARISGKTSELDVNVTGGGDVVSSISFDDADFSLTGGGDVVVNCSNSNSCDLSITGGGSAKLKGSTKEFEASLTGGGDVNASEFEAVDCKISLSGGGSASVFASNKIDVALSGGGDLVCYGKPSIINKRVSGGSSFKLIK